MLRLHPRSTVVEPLCRAIAPMWTNNTWTSRSRLWDRLTRFCNDANVDIRRTRPSSCISRPAESGALHGSVVCQKPPIRIQPRQNPHRPTSAIHEGFAGERSARTHKADESSHTMATEQASSQTYLKGLNRSTDMLEGSCKMDRSCGTNERTVHQNRQERSYHLLGKKHLNDSTEPLPHVDVHNNNRSRDTGNSRTCKVDDNRSKIHQHDGKRNGPDHPESMGNEFRHSFNQTRCGDAPVSGNTSRKGNNRRRTKSRKASERYFPLTVQCKPGNNREGTRYTSSFGAPPTPITQADVDK